VQSGKETSAMGDKSNVYIQTKRRWDGWLGIGIYAHYGGSKLHRVAISHIPHAKNVIGDPSYFSRVIIQRTLNDLADPDSETGFGIWMNTDFTRSERYNRVLVINALTGRHWFATDATYREDEPQGEGNE
jgi:hypothetical protein